MGLMELLNVAGIVPLNPPRPIDWPNVEGELSLSLPTDYKALFTACGPGTFGGYIHLKNFA